MTQRCLSAGIVLASVAVMALARSEAPQPAMKLAAFLIVVFAVAKLVVR